MSVRGGDCAALVCMAPVSIEKENFLSRIPAAVCMNAISLFYIPDNLQGHVDNGGRLPSIQIGLTIMLKSVCAACLIQICLSTLSLHFTHIRMCSLPHNIHQGRSICE